MKRFLILLLLWSLPVLAGETAPTAKVKEVVDGDTVVLAQPVDGATQVRFTGIQAPKLPLGRAGFKQWPLAPEAKTFLEGLCLGKTVRLDFTGRRMDRHGRLLAHLTTADGKWLQGEMLAAGLARVYTFADNREKAAELYALERAARAARRGIWADPFYAVRPADPTVLHRDRDTFQVIEGVVADAANVHGTVYLNFGANWREDFTARIGREALKLFLKSGLKPEALKGQTIRVRGWLKEYNGPLIDVSHPEQIERVESRR